MGRFLLLLAAAAAVISGVAGVGMLERKQAQTRILAGSEAGSLARQAALSGLAITEYELRHAYGTEVSYEGVSLDGGTFGTYDAEIRAVAGGMAVEVTGRFADASQSFTAFYEERLDVPAALMLYGNAVDPKMDKDGTVSGAVTRPPSIASAGWSAAGRPGIAGIATSLALQAIFVEELDADEIDGITGSPAFLDAAPPDWIRAVADEVEAHPSVIAVEKYELKEGTAGSPANPVFIVATEEIKIEKSTGYGVIVLRGGGKVQFKESTWEGLILVEAVAGDDDEKVELKIDDDSAIYGAVVGFGIEANPDEEVAPGGAGPGLAGGHFDLDFFVGDASGIGREYHKHEYDDKYDLTYLDFLDGPDIKDSYGAFLGRAGHKKLDIEFYNEFNGSGTYQIGGYSGTVRDGFSLTDVRPEDLDPFIINFVNLQELRGSSPGTVKGDDAERDRSFSVRFYDGPTLIYEVSAYEHAKSYRDGIPTSSLPGSVPTEDGSATADASLVYGEFKIEIGENAGVYWAPDVLARFNSHLTSLRDAIGMQRRMIGDVGAIGS